MPELPFPDDVRALLRKPNPAVVSTLRSDGQPVSVAMQLEYNFNLY